MKSSTKKNDRATAKADARFAAQKTDPFRVITDEDLAYYAPAETPKTGLSHRELKKRQREVERLKREREKQDAQEAKEATRAASAAAREQAVVDRQQAKAAEKISAQEAREEARAQKKELRACKREANAPRRHKVLLGVATVFVLLIFSGALIYPSAQEYYKTVRAEDKLQAEYDAISARNDQLQSNIDNLNTDAGIEDQARQYGYVQPGENAVSVTNSGETSQTTVVPESVDTEDVKAPDTWYTKILDKVFGVEG